MTTQTERDEQFQQVLKLFDEEYTAHRKGIARADKHRATYETILRDLSKVNLRGATLMADGGLYLSITGDKHDLAALFSVLRRHGFNSLDRPQAGQTSYSSYWTNKNYEIDIHIMFTSTVCRRVQVGTKIQEVPVYDIICDEQVFP